MKRKIFIAWLLLISLILLPACRRTPPPPIETTPSVKVTTSTDGTIGPPNTDEVPIGETSHHPPQTEPAEPADTEPSAETQAPSVFNATTSITMLNVGQGLSVLVQSGDEYMLYDGGGRNYSSYVVSYLAQHGVKHLKYMITSHYDEDHINGLIGVMNTTTIDTVLRPDYVHSSNLYQSYLKMLEKNGAKSVFPKVGDRYKLGSAVLTVLSPTGYDNEDVNNNSIVISIVDGSFECIITGDAEQEMESDMVARGVTFDCDLYVVGHHGSSSSSSKKFIEAIRPEYAFISVGAGNKYGHPTEKTMNTLKTNGVQIFRSDLQKEVTCQTNGKQYLFDKEPSTDYSSGSNTAVVGDNDEIVEVKPEDAKYVLNNSSMKFHTPDCKHAQSISEYNRFFSNESREDLIAQGYSPCGVCRP